MTASTTTAADKFHGESYVQSLFHGTVLASALVLSLVINSTTAHRGPNPVWAVLYQALWEYMAGCSPRRTRSARGRTPA